MKFHELIILCLCVFASSYVAYTFDAPTFQTSFWFLPMMVFIFFYGIKQMTKLDKDKIYESEDFR